MKTRAWRIVVTLVGLVSCGGNSGERGTTPDTQCMDGVDNDGDGRTDFQPMTVGGGDPQCTNPLDDSESA